MAPAQPSRIRCTRSGLTSTTRNFATSRFNYQSIGSGGGIQQVTAGTVDFGASDGPMNDQQIKEFQRKARVRIFCISRRCMGADVPTYNIPGVTAQLNFTPEALAGIFLGKITKWNDPAIAEREPGSETARQRYRGGASRRMAAELRTVLVDYLSKVSKEWETKVGRGTSVNWPVGLGGKGNEGVAGQVKQTPNSIGYVELIYAVQNKMPYGKVKNAAGEFVQASLASVTAAAAGAPRQCRTTSGCRLPTRRARRLIRFRRSPGC